MFFEIIRIVRKKQPRYILLENVKGLLSSNKGWDFARILVELGDAGYSVEWAVYNSKNFGVPQNRQRVFIIGYLGGERGSKIFPIGEGSCHTDESGEQSECMLVSNAIDSNYYKGADGKRQLIAIGHTRDKSGKASYHPLEIFGTIKQQSGNQTNYIICDSGLSRKKQVRTEVIAPLRANTGAAYNNIVGSIRRLTPLECERLQGFPDRFTEGISDTQRYRCLGNAVTVPVIEAVMTVIREKGGL